MGGNKTKRLVIIPLLVGVIILFSGNAQAGFVNPANNPGAEPFTCDFNNIQYQHQWQFDYDMPQLVLSETIHFISRTWFL
jgi:glycerol uptake facilitator-like aquaporin